MSEPERMHFSGAIRWSNGRETFLVGPGYPTCSVGLAAHRILDRDNHTDRASDVTCERCLRALSLRTEATS